MKLSAWFSVAAALLLASTGHAQLSAVRYGENFDLDDYASPGQREMPQSSPFLSWISNDNVTRITPGPSQSRLPACYHVPGRLNVSRGDAVLSTERGSLIYKLLSSLGQTYSHSGMARDSQSIRHNTMATHALRLVESGGIPQYLRPTGDRSLRDGWPGTITHSVEAAMSYRDFVLQDGLVLTSGPAFDLTRNLERFAADAEMNAFRGWYSLYAYTNMTWRDPYRRSDGDGNMCSGSIFHAHLQAGNRGWSWSQRRSYPSSVRQPAASLLYNEIRSSILNSPDFLERFGLWANAFVGGTDFRDFATRAANQVVNCMAFNDCGNRAGRWRDGVGSGASLSPDDLQTLVVVAALGAALGGRENTFVYTAAKPLEKTGDYYCCIREATEDVWPSSGFSIPQERVHYTKCAKQF